MISCAIRRRCIYRIIFRPNNIMYDQQVTILLDILVIGSMGICKNVYFDWRVSGSLG